VSVVEDLEAPRATPVVISGARGGPPLQPTQRQDRWWIQPTLVAIGLLGFTGYVIWAALRNGNFYAGNVGRGYLSPLYSPCVTHSCQEAGYVWGPIFGDWWRVSPAWLILIFPGAFRATCYYYRKAYYRAFFFSPPSCAVADVGSGPNGHRRRYRGETRFPLVLQNIHRYTWYIALAFAGILTWDAINAFRFAGRIGIGVGTVIFVANAVFIWAYTLGCHACRHLCGGGLRQFSTAKVRHFLWKNVVTELNAHHQLFAWCSLFSIVACDLYTWLVATGTITDPKFLF
jgi:hypothetical protein